MTQTGLAIKTPLFVTHRLDTLTSGLIVYAKKKQFVKEFNLQLIARKVEKKYLALIENSELLPDLLTHYMDPSPGTPKALSTEPQDGWSICQLQILEQTQMAETIQ